MTDTASQPSGDVAGLVERLCYTGANGIFDAIKAGKYAYHIEAAAAITALSAERDAKDARIAELEEHWRALDRITTEHFKEGPEPHRVRWDGVWHEGPIADAYVTTMLAIRKLVAAAAIRKGEA